mgnify:FL=1
MGARSSMSLQALIDGLLPETRDRWLFSINVYDDIHVLRRRSYYWDLQGFSELMRDLWPTVKLAYSQYPETWSTARGYAPRGVCACHYFVDGLEVAMCHPDIGAGLLFATPRTWSPDFLLGLVGGSEI